MDNEKMIVNFGEGATKKELIIRTVSGEDPSILPVQEPEHLNVSGTIGVVAEFLQKRWNAEDAVEAQIDHNRTHVLVDRDNCKITLITNEDDKRHSQIVTGVLQYSRQYTMFGINTDKQWDPIEMGQFFKMFRAYFEDKTVNMELVTKLKSFKATVNTTIERQEKENGSRVDNYAAIVDSTLPDAFTIQIPIFKGSNAEKLDVEIYAKVSGREVALMLMSPDAISAVEDVRDKKIDNELDRIREIAPEIPILEV